MMDPRDCRAMDHPPAGWVMGRIRARARARATVQTKAREIPTTPLSIRNNPLCGPHSVRDWRSGILGFGLQPSLVPDGRLEMDCAKQQEQNRVGQARESEGVSEDHERDPPQTVH